MGKPLKIPFTVEASVSLLEIPQRDCLCLTITKTDKRLEIEKYKLGKVSMFLAVCFNF